MAGKQISNMHVENLGKAITLLGLEDRFLSDKEFLNFSLGERGKIVSDIVYEKLRLGRLEEVVEMVYGDSGKAGVLFDGDRQKLKKEIIKSIMINPQKYIDSKILESLFKGNNGLFFKFANASPFNYKKFRDITNSIDVSYFEDTERGSIRNRAFNKIAGKRALKDEKYYSASHHFEEIDYKKGLTELFESAIAEGGGDANHVLERIALTDHEQKESRLKRIILESKLKPLEKFKLYQEHDISLTQKEKNILYGEVAKTANKSDLQRELSDADPKLRLSWAKKHAKTEPRVVYKILRDSNRKQDEIAKVNAILCGLQISWREEQKERRLEVDEIKKEDLKKTYGKSPFDVKVKIAQYLRKEKGFDKKLMELSRQAYEKGELQKAYDLWGKSGSGFDGKYINNIKKKLIEDGIKNHSGYIPLHKFDKNGNIQAFDALMQQGTPGMIEDAYELAVEKGVDNKRIEGAREAMVEISPEWALSIFRGYKEDETKDPKGVEYVVKTISRKYGANEGTLKSLVEKYPL